MIATEVGEYLPYREGLKRIDYFIAGKTGFVDLAPFTLPAIIRDQSNNSTEFFYYLGAKTGKQRYLRFG
ncbi:MAG: hypothetical protein G01um101493_193, partial [Microgenomates group bacterium Gr01-1014_93]